MKGFFIFTGSCIGVCIFIFLMVILYISMEYEEFQRFPKKIDGKKSTNLYIRTIMSFKKWKQLFELDPRNFVFINREGKFLAVDRVKCSFSYSHPAYYDDEEQRYYLVEFKFWDYFQYHFYGDKIQDMYSNIFNDKISKNILGDIQSKIDALVEQSERDLKKSIDLHQKIILQLSNDDPTNKEGQL